MTKIYTLRSPIRVYSFQPLQNKAEGFALCYQAEEDLVEFEDCGPGDKGTEAGVFGKQGLVELGVRHQPLEQGQQRGGRIGHCQPEKIRDAYLL